MTDFREWPYSSYHAHLSARPTHLKRKEVLAWFEGAEERFAQTHQRVVEEQQVAALAPDDFD